MFSTLQGFGQVCRSKGLEKSYAKFVHMPRRELYKNLLGETLKMACPTYGILPRVTCPGAFYANRGGQKAICSDCYAGRGNYNIPETKGAHIRRIVAFLKDPDFWTRMVSAQVLGSASDFMRIHDAGDFFSPEYLQAWINVAKKCREVNFFAPTRNWRKAEYLPLLQKLPGNFVIRPSALHIDQEEFKVPKLGAPAYVSVGQGTCPASAKHSNCETENCRACWLNPKDPVIFQRHY